MASSNFPLFLMELAQRTCNELGYEGYRQQTDQIHAEVAQEMKDQAAYRAEREAEQEAYFRDHPECLELSPEEEADWVKEYAPVSEAPERGSDPGIEREADEGPER